MKDKIDDKDSELKSKLKISDRKNNQTTINRFSTNESNLTKNIYSFHDISNIIYNNKTKLNNEYDNLRKEVLIQNKILKEYEHWAMTLVQIISDQEMTDNHLDFGTPIQQRLLELENLSNENLEIKKKIIEQNKLNEKFENKLKIKKWNLINCVKDFNSPEKQDEGKDILENNVQKMANELDNLLELKMDIDTTLNENDENFDSNEEDISNQLKNQNSNSLFSPKKSSCSSKFMEKIKNNNINNEIKKISELYNEKKSLEEENEVLRKISEIFIPERIKDQMKSNVKCKIFGVCKTCTNDSIE